MRRVIEDRPCPKTGAASAGNHDENGDLALPSIHKFRLFPPGSVGLLCEAVAGTDLSRGDEPTAVSHSVDSFYLRLPYSSPARKFDPRVDCCDWLVYSIFPRRARRPPARFRVSEIVIVG